MLAATIRSIMSRSLLGAGCLALAACAIDPRGADTFTQAGVLTGSILSEEDCAQWPDTAVWVTVDGDGYCLRYFHGGLQEETRTAVVFLHGDVMFQTWDGRASLFSGYAEQVTPDYVQSLADRGAEIGLPYIRLSRPGTYGSSGDHRLRRQAINVRIVDAALEALKARYGIETYALAGQSGGGHLVASMLSRRDDIRCAAISSGVVSIHSRSHMHGWFGRDFTGFWRYDDPIDHAAKIPDDPDRRIFVIGDPRDNNVFFDTQREYHYTLRILGHHSELVEAAAPPPSHHDLSWEGIRAAAACAEGLSTNAVLTRLRDG